MSRNSLLRRQLIAHAQLALHTARGEHHPRRSLPTNHLEVAFVFSNLTERQRQHGYTCRVHERDAVKICDQVAVTGFDERVEGALHPFGGG